MLGLAEKEKQKYLSVWEHDSYRRVSPAEYETERAWHSLGCSAGDTLNDYGSGTCRATHWFARRGLDVLAIDHAPNARETPVPFADACLWDMGVVRDSHFGLCCDVMEHIPRERVNRVFRMISERTTRAAYFRIATRMDVMGMRLIGEPLHLSIEPGDFWLRMAGMHFNSVDRILDNGRDVVFLGRNGV